MKELRSLIGAVSQINIVVPELATIYFPFRMIFKMGVTWKWTKKMKESFEQKPKIEKYYRNDAFLRRLPDEKIL